MDTIVMAQTVIDTSVSFVWIFCINFLDEPGNFLIFLLSGTFLAGCPLVIGRTGYMEYIAAQLNRSAVLCRLPLNSMV